MNESHKFQKGCHCGSYEYILHLPTTHSMNSSQSNSWHHFRFHSQPRVLHDWWGMGHWSRSHCKYPTKQTIRETLTPNHDTLKMKQLNFHCPHDMLTIKQLPFHHSHDILAYCLFNNKFNFLPLSWYIGILSNQ